MRYRCCVALCLGACTALTVGFCSWAWNRPRGLAQFWPRGLTQLWHSTRWPFDWRPGEEGAPLAELARLHEAEVSKQAAEIAQLRALLRERAPSANASWDGAAGAGAAAGGDPVAAGSAGGDGGVELAVATAGGSRRRSSRARVRGPAAPPKAKRKLGRGGGAASGRDGAAAPAAAGGAAGAEGWCWCDAPGVSAGFRCQPPPGNTTAAASGSGGGLADEPNATAVAVTGSCAEDQVCLASAWTSSPRGPPGGDNASHCKAFYAHSKTILINSDADPLKKYRDLLLPDCAWRCTVRMDQAAFRAADAVVFDVMRMNILRKAPKLAEKPRGQRWVFRSSEAPYLGYRQTKPLAMDQLHPGLDYTMTYKGSSDFFQPFGWVVPLAAGAEANSDPLSALAARPGFNWASNRSQYLMIAHINDCAAPRLRIWFELSRYLPKSRTALFGLCGSKAPCKAQKDSDPCWQDLHRSTKFYFAAEKIRCDGYVTEDFFSALSRGSLPVVLGGLARKDYERIAPGSAFIHVDDFPSFAALAKHLLQLDRDDTRYNQHFTWRRWFQVGTRTARLQPYCSLCENLHKPTGERLALRRFGSSLDAWWFEKRLTCTPYGQHWNGGGGKLAISRKPLCSPGAPCEDPPFVQGALALAPAAPAAPAGRSGTTPA